MEFNLNIDRKGKQPVYLQIRDQLKQQILRRQIPADTQLPNVEIIASLGQCSLRTADLAMQALVTDGVCYRRPKQGTFVRASAKPQVRHICGIWSVLRKQDFSRNILTSLLVQGAMKATEGTALDVTLICDDPEDTVRFYNSNTAFDFHGLLVVEPESFPRMLELASEFPHIRFVMLDFHLRLPADCPKNVFLVTNDDALGASLLLQHYVSSGMRKFAIFQTILPYQDLTYEERIRGFVRSIEVNSLPFDMAQNLVTCELPKPGEIAQAGYIAAQKYLGSGKRPDVICAVNDLLADGVKQCVDEMGLGAQIRVSGYDMMIPELTQKNRFDSVQVDYAAMSRTGIALLQEDAPQSQKTMILPQIHLI